MYPVPRIRNEHTHTHSHHAIRWERVEDIYIKCYTHYYIKYFYSSFIFFRRVLQSAAEVYKVFYIDIYACIACGVFVFLCIF